MKNDVKIIDNVLPKNVLEFCYSFIIEDPIWHLTMGSSESGYNIAGRTLWDKTKNLSSKTSSQIVACIIYQCIKSKAKFLSNNIIRIHLGAKAALQDDLFHKDSIEDNYTVLFYLNPIWKKEWGGETIVNNKVYEYKPNRALIYKSNLLHGGKSPKSPIFRTYLNYVVGK